MSQTNQPPIPKRAEEVFPWARDFVAWVKARIITDAVGAYLTGTVDGKTLVVRSSGDPDPLRWTLSVGLSGGNPFVVVGEGALRNVGSTGTINAFALSKAAGQSGWDAPTTGNTKLVWIEWTPGTTPTLEIGAALPTVSDSLERVWAVGSVTNTSGVYTFAQYLHSDLLETHHDDVRLGTADRWGQMKGEVITLEDDDTSADNTIDLDPKQIKSVSTGSVTGKTIKVRELTICDSGTTKKMLVLCSETY